MLCELLSIVSREEITVQEELFLRNLDPRNDLLPVSEKWSRSVRKSTFSDNLLSLRHLSVFYIHFLVWSL